MSAGRLQSLHEEFPLDDEEFSGGQRAETLVHHDEEECPEPEDTIVDVLTQSPDFDLVTMIQR